MPTDHESGDTPTPSQGEPPDNVVPLPGLEPSQVIPSPEFKLDAEAFEFGRRMGKMRVLAIMLGLDPSRGVLWEPAGKPNISLIPGIPGSMVRVGWQLTCGFNQQPILFANPHLVGMDDADQALNFIINAVAAKQAKQRADHNQG